MTNRIENLLIYTLEQAAQAVADARKELAGREAEVAEVTALLADHRRRNAPPAPTEAWAAVPPRPMDPQNMVAADCGNCGQQISRNMPGDRWLHQDGCVECPIPGGTSAEPYILPAPPAAATVTDPPADETPKDGADHG